jgi:uncharacterized glyoxalase superfamily protein PhnB
MTVQAQPARYHTVIPYLVIENAAQCVDFLVAAFGAREEGGRMPAPGGKIGHTELRLGDSLIMLADATAEFPAHNAMIHIYVPDADAAYLKALASGGTSAREPATQFYGDRVAAVNAFGIYWSLATHVEDVSPEEMQRRVAKLMGG